jgi:hypothetical protein
MKYRMVIAPDLGALEDMVNKRLTQGWTLQGGPCGSGHTWGQAMLEPAEIGVPA